MMNLHNVSLDKFLTYKTLIQEKSFSKASALTQRSYSSLINDIHTLERGLGIKLYMPTKKIFIPTEEGLRMLAIAEEMFEKFLFENKDIKNHEENVSIKIRASQATHLIYLNKINEIIQKNPHITFELHLNPFKELEDFSYDFDIFIGNINTREALAKRILARIEYTLYASKEYLKNAKPIQSIADLKDHKLMVFAGYNQLDSTIIEANQVSFKANSYATLTEACANHMGIASLPSDLVDKFYKDKKLVRLFKEKAFEYDDVYFYYKRHSHKQKTIMHLFKEFKNLYEHPIADGEV